MKPREFVGKNDGEKKIEEKKNATNETKNLLRWFSGKPQPNLSRISRFVDRFGVNLARCDFSFFFFPSLLWQPTFTNHFADCQMRFGRN